MDICRKGNVEGLLGSVEKALRRRLALFNLPQWSDDNLLQLMSWSQSWPVAPNFDRIFIKCSGSKFEPFV